MKAVISIPAIVALVYRAYSHKSLTVPGLIAAALTAVIHAIHPWSLPFSLLVVFYLGGTKATKVCSFSPRQKKKKKKKKTPNVKGMMTVGNTVLIVTSTTETGKT